MAAYRANIDAELEQPIKYRSNPDDPNSKVYTNKAKTYLMLQANFDPCDKSDLCVDPWAKFDGSPEIAKRGREIHQTLVDNYRAASPGGALADNTGISPEEMQEYRDTYGSGSAGYYYLKDCKVTSIRCEEPSYSLHYCQTLRQIRRQML